MPPVRSAGTGHQGCASGRMLTCVWPWDAGQERKEVPFANHTACTIEMTNLQRRVDVAVIDEIQVGLHRHWGTLAGSSCTPLPVCSAPVNVQVRRGFPDAIRPSGKRSRALPKREGAKEARPERTVVFRG